MYYYVRLLLWGYGRGDMSYCICDWSYTRGVLTYCVDYWSSTRGDMTYCLGVGALHYGL